MVVVDVVDVCKIKVWLIKGVGACRACRVVWCWTVEMAKGMRGGFWSFGWREELTKGRKKWMEDGSRGR